MPNDMCKITASDFIGPFWFPFRHPIEPLFADSPRHAGSLTLVHNINFYFLHLLHLLKGTSLIVLSSFHHETRDTFHNSAFSCLFCATALHASQKIRGKKHACITCSDVPLSIMHMIFMTRTSCMFYFLCTFGGIMSRLDISPMLESSLCVTVEL